MGGRLWKINILLQKKAVIGQLLKFKIAIIDHFKLRFTKAVNASPFSRFGKFSVQTFYKVFLLLVSSFKNSCC
jgi:hypothetical protein